MDIFAILTEKRILIKLKNLPLAVHLYMDVSVDRQ
jgi:hypothetical protein